MTAFAPPPSFRGGSGEPLVLIHGVTGTWQWWRHLLPALTAELDVFAPTLPGHAGGPDLQRPASIDGFVDGAESAMDAAGLVTAHIVGHSLGGWVAFELARRGRARSVVGINPAGGWWDRKSASRVVRLFLRGYYPARLFGRPVLAAQRSSVVRRIGFRDFVADPAAMTPEQARHIVEGVASFDMHIVRDLITNHRVQTFPDPGVPTVLAWGERERMFPAATYGKVWREAAPHAIWRVVPGAGHDADIDNPAEVTALIIDSVGAAR
jgi:pimeloyl-ACP methyl ester carboxylesterase